MKKNIEIEKNFKTPKAIQKLLWKFRLVPRPYKLSFFYFRICDWRNSMGYRSLLFQISATREDYYPMIIQMAYTRFVKKGVKNRFTRCFWGELVGC